MKINEIFGPTIQGEGKSAMREVIFIRTALCNLKCVWCDTPYTWNWTMSDKEIALFDPLTPVIPLPTFSKECEVHEMTEEEIISKIMEIGPKVVSRIVLSGGEPLIQQKQLIPLLRKLNDLGFSIEVETNGTIMPTDEFLEVVEQINCSPKLANSGNIFQKRIKAKVLKALSENGKTNFKFVVASKADVAEILTLVNRYNMKEVYLMPEGRTVDELKSHEQLVLEVCLEHNFNFTQREHIVLFGSKRGV